MLGSKFSNFHGRSFFHAYTLHTCLRVHSPYSYLVHTLQDFIFFILTLSTHVLEFTLHTVTLQAHVRFKIYKFSREFILFILTLSTHVSGFILYTVIWFTLSKHMLVSKSSFFHAYTLHTCFRVHSPYSYLVYTLQAHVRFKIFKFSRSSFFFFILTLSTHVSGFPLHTVIWFTLSNHMLGSKFSNFHGRSFFHAYTLHTCFRVHSPYSYFVHTLQAHVRFKIFGFSQDFIFFILTLSTHVLEFTLHAVVLHSPSRCYISKFYIVIIISSCA